MNSEKTRRLQAAAFAVLAAALYALNAPTSKILLGHAGATMTAGFLYLGAGVGLAVCAAVKKLAKTGKKEEKLTKKELPYTLAMIILDIAAPILLMLGLGYTGAASVSLLGNFEIVATSLVALVFFGEKISPRLWCAIGLITAASLPEADTVVTAVSGMVGLKPTLAAIREKKRIALANKETLVCAGELVMEQAKTYGAEIIPVDSEHSAIFQCLMGNRGKTQIKRLILTCSGGPFYGLSRAELAEKKKADALRHPNWKMGAKITIDCATLMNKGLEIIEAMRLYDLPLEKVTAVVHRQSIVHSMVEFTDGAVMAQLGAPDMRIPISLAMTYPERKQTPAPALDLLSCPPLTFAEIDEGSFDCFRLAKEAAKRGGTVCAAMNAANEEAVALYLQDIIGFYDISELVARAMELPSVERPKLRDILAADKAARELVWSRFFR